MNILLVSLFLVPNILIYFEQYRSGICAQYVTEDKNKYVYENNFDNLNNLKEDISKSSALFFSNKSYENLEKNKYDDILETQKDSNSFLSCIKNNELIKKFNNSIVLNSSKRVSRNLYEDFSNNRFLGIHKRDINNDESNSYDDNEDNYEQNFEEDSFLETNKKYNPEENEYYDYDDEGDSYVEESFLETDKYDEDMDDEFHEDGNNHDREESFLEKKENMNDEHDDYDDYNDDYEETSYEEEYSGDQDSDGNYSEVGNTNDNYYKNNNKNEASFLENNYDNSDGEKRSIFVSRFLGKHKNQDNDTDNNGESFFEKDSYNYDYDEDHENNHDNDNYEEDNNLEDHEYGYDEYDYDFNEDEHSSPSFLEKEKTNNEMHDEYEDEYDYDLDFNTDDDEGFTGSNSISYDENEEKHVDKFDNHYLNHISQASDVQSFIQTDMNIVNNLIDEHNKDAKPNTKKEGKGLKKKTTVQDNPTEKEDLIEDTEDISNEELNGIMNDDMNDPELNENIDLNEEATQGNNIKNEDLIEEETNDKADEDVINRDIENSVGGTLENTVSDESDGAPVVDEERENAMKNETEDNYENLDENLVDQGTNEDTLLKDNEDINRSKLMLRMKRENPIYPHNHHANPHKNGNKKNYTNEENQELLGQEEETQDKEISQYEPHDELNENKSTGSTSILSSLVILSITCLYLMINK